MSTTERYVPRLHHHLLAEFKVALHELRERAGLPTFRTMSRRTGVGAATLWRAESGEHVPSLLTTIAYIEACDGDQRLWDNQHHDLLVSLNGGVTSRRIAFVPWRDYFDHEKAPPPSVRVLRKEMRRLWFVSGLTLRELSARTENFRWVVGEYGLGVSTISELCNPDQVRVPRRRTVHGFLRAVEASSESIERWLAVRNQLAAKQDPLLNEIPPANPGDAGPRVVAVGTGETTADSGQQHLALLRRLRNDIVQGGTARAVTADRIRNVLSSLGVDPAVVASVLADAPHSITFVVRLHQTVSDIMADADLPASATSLVLELAVSRTSTDYLRVFRGAATARAT